MKYVLSLLLLSATPALATSGKTADGCTYRVINGQYLTSCDSKSDTVKQASAAPQTVTNYGAVPMRNNPAAPAPSIQPISTMNVQVPSQSTLLEAKEERREEREMDKAVDLTYVGAQLGSTSIKNANSSTGGGVTLGTNLDDHFGVELGYNYTKQGLQLGLNSRGGPGAYTPVRGNDASLRSHLISGEAQAYLTDALKRLRPYAGLGLGWKSSTLEENSYGYGGGSMGSLNQTSLGAIGSLGAKFRVGQSIQLGLMLSYFLPFSRQDARLEQASSPYGYAAPMSRLVREDDALTGAGQSQIQGGVQYLF